MARLSASLLLLSLLGTGLVSASPDWNQAEENENSECDNNCFFGSFPGGSCTNDPACMCTQQKYREKYFCCMAEKCAASVMPDSIQRQTTECNARNMQFTFDAEKVCGIKLTATTSVVSGAAASHTTVISDVESMTSTVHTTSNAFPTSSAVSSSPSGASSTVSATPTANSASYSQITLNGAVILVAAYAMFW